MIKRAIEILRKSQKRNLVQEIVYIHDGVEITLRAVLGSTSAKAANQYGMWSRTTWDFIVQAEDLDFTPQSGDTIVYDGFTYEVTESESTTPWQWSDPHHTAMRIHTKLQEEETSE